jgi:hypothetical protein
MTREQVANFGPEAKKSSVEGERDLFLFADMEPEPRATSTPSVEDDLYRLYPRHVAPRVAKAAITKALYRLTHGIESVDLAERNKEIGRHRTAFEFLAEAIECFAESPAGRRKQYTPHPSTWFNGSRYLDDPGEWFTVDREEKTRADLLASQGIGVWKPT